MSSSNTLTKSDMDLYISSFKKDSSSQEVSRAFIETLYSYKENINNLKLEEMIRHREIPETIASVLKNPILRAEREVSDILAESLLGFICPINHEPYKEPSIWATKNLIYTRNDKSKFPDFNAQDCIQAIQEYPNEYLDSLSDNELVILAQKEPQQPLFNHIMESLLKRSLSIPQHIFKNVDLEIASPKLLLLSFKNFVEAPILLAAHQFVDVFLKRPTLHLMCVRIYQEFSQDDFSRALSLIGRVLSPLIPLNFPLAVLYHPMIEELINEVERVNLDEARADQQYIAQILTELGYRSIPLLIPFFYEFPQWKNFIFNIMPDFEEATEKTIQFTTQTQ